MMMRMIHYEACTYVGMCVESWVLYMGTWWVSGPYGDGVCGPPFIPM